MNGQIGLFDPPAPGSRPVDPHGEADKKYRGMELAAVNNAARLATVRAVARRVARDGDGTADVERVRAACAADGHVFPWGNWAGSIFKTEEWTFDGRWVAALHPGGHARMVRVWRLT